MEISKQNIFKTEYTSLLGDVKEKKRTSIFKFIKKHKLIVGIGMIFLTTCLLNMALVYNFMKILEQM